MNMPDTPNPSPPGWETLTYISHLCDFTSGVSVPGGK